MWLPRAGLSDWHCVALGLAILCQKELLVLPHFLAHHPTLECLCAYCPVERLHEVSMVLIAR